MPYNVFVSYSWSNSAERRALAAEIAGVENVQVLLDKDFISPGDPIHSTVLRMVDAADCFVVLLTVEGLQSREVLDEITRAHDRNKLIIPVLAEGTTLEALPWHLRDLLWVPYNLKNFDSVVEIVTGAIRKRANPLAGIDRSVIPENVAALIDSGTQFIDVPLPTMVKMKHPLGARDSLFYILKMRQTEAVFVFRVSKLMPVSVAADVLSEEILPHLESRHYDWSIVWQDKILPTEHTFAMVGVPSGSTLYLLGNHSMPQWAPCPSR